MTGALMDSLTSEFGTSGDEKVAVAFAKTVDADPQGAFGDAEIGGDFGIRDFLGIGRQAGSQSFELSGGAFGP